MNYDQAKTVRFRAREERQMLTEVARMVARNESEVLRILVRSAYEALTKDPRRTAKLAQEGRALGK